MSQNSEIKNTTDFYNVPCKTDTLKKVHLQGIFSFIINITIESEMNHHEQDHLYRRANTAIESEPPR